MTRTHVNGLGSTLAVSCLSTEARGPLYFRSLLGCALLGMHMVEQDSDQGFSEALSDVQLMPWKLHEVTVVSCSGALHSTVSGSHD